MPTGMGWYTSKGISFGESACTSRDAVWYSFIVACVNKQPVGTLTTSSRGIQTFRGVDWTEQNIFQNVCRSLGYKYNSNFFPFCCDFLVDFILVAFHDCHFDIVMLIWMPICLHAHWVLLAGSTLFLSSDFVSPMYMEKWVASFWGLLQQMLTDVLRYILLALFSYCICLLLTLWITPLVLLVGFVSL